MPTYNPQSVYPHPPPALPPQTSAHMMTCELAKRYELQAQNQYVRHLELENMRLRVKLEQAEKDIQLATNMVIVACRSGQSGVMPSARALTEVKPAEDTWKEASNAQNTPSLGHGEPHHEVWGHGDPMQWKSSEDYTDGFCASPTALYSPLRDLYKPPRATRLPRAEGQAWDEYKSSNSVLQQQHEQLLDLNDAAFTTPRPKVATAITQKWSTPPPLRPLTPFAPPTKYKLADPFVTPVKKSKDATATDNDTSKADKPRFHHIFRHDSDETEETTEFSVGKAVAVEFLQKKKEILAQSEIPDFVSKIPDVKLSDRTTLSPTAHKRDVSTETGYPSTEENKASDDDKPAAVGATRENNGAAQSFGSSDDLGVVDFPRGPSGFQSRRGGYGDRYDMGAFRYNVNKPPPRTDEDVRHTPEVDSKNIYRTVMIYNLPPQVDVADIVAHAGDAPLLSVKLLPTVGMKGRKGDGSVAKLETTTAMIKFFRDTSADQFVFDAAVEPLIIRGRTAIVKLLQTPTYPSIHDQTAYATAPGRLITRRFKFHQPGLVPADIFEETLARNSYGFRQPGWIVNKTIKKEAGKNMVMIELASVDLAQFAYNRIGWLREFQGCEPRWVYDHESVPMSGRRGSPKTVDVKDDCEGEGFSGFGTEDDAEVTFGANAASQNTSA